MTSEPYAATSIRPRVHQLTFKMYVFAKLKRTELNTAIAVLFAIHIPIQLPASMSA